MFAAMIHHTEGSEVEGASVTWFKVDDRLHSHPKAIKAGDAMSLWVMAGSWCADQLTDGFVPAYMPTRLVGEPGGRYAATLVTVGLWEVVGRDGEDGFCFHDWHDMQPTRDQVMEVRNAAAKRQAEWRERKRRQREREKSGDDAEESNGGSNAVTAPVTLRVTEDVTDAVTNDEVTLYARGARAAVDPTRPDPTIRRTSPPLASLAAPPAGGRRRGSRLPEPFPVTSDMAAWARQNAPGTDDRDHEAFVDYWRSIPGQKGVKLDWVATWRNWMRRESDRRGGVRPVNGRRSTTDDRVSAGLALAARYEAMEDQPAIGGSG